MAVAPNQVIRVTHRFLQLPGGFAENVYHFLNISGLTLDNVDVLNDMQDLFALLEGALDDVMVNTVSFVELHVYNITADQPVGTTPSAGGAGTLAEDPLPSGVSALVTLETGNKRTIGKKFLPGLSETTTTAGVFNAAAIADLLQAAAFMLGTQTVNGHDWLPGIVKVSTGVFYPVITALVRSTPSYQRRRKQGVGI